MITGCSLIWKILRSRLRSLQHWTNATTICVNGSVKRRYWVIQPCNWNASVILAGIAEYDLFTVMTSGFFCCSCLSIFNLLPRSWGSNLPPDLLCKVMILGHQCTVKKKNNQSLSNECNTCSIQWSNSEKQNWNKRIPPHLWS